jgi:hypothetical protein
MHTEFHDGLDPTRFDARRIPRLLWSDPDDVVAASLAALERGQTVCVPGVQYRLVRALARTGLIGLGLSLARR